MTISLLLTNGFKNTFHGFFPNDCVMTREINPEPKRMLPKIPQIVALVTAKSAKVPAINTDKKPINMIKMENTFIGNVPNVD